MGLGKFQPLYCGKVAKKSRIFLILARSSVICWSRRRILFADSSTILSTCSSNGLLTGAEEVPNENGGIGVEEVEDPNGAGAGMTGAGLEDAPDENEGKEIDEVEDPNGAGAGTTGAGLEDAPNENGDVGVVEGPNGPNGKELCGAGGFEILNELDPKIEVFGKSGNLKSGKW